MKVPIIIVFLGGLIFFAHLLNGLFKYTKIPSALWLLVIGIVIGPIMGFVSAEDFGEVGPVFTSITLIILLFVGGVNLNIRELGSTIGSAFLLTLANFILSSAIAAVFAFYFTSLDSWLSATFFGVIVGGTSSAVVIPIVNQLKINKDGTTILLLESALSDVFCLVIGLALLSAMEVGVFSIKSILNVVWKSFAFASLLGVGAGIAWSVIIRWMRAIPNNMFTNLALVFIVAGSADYIGWNGGIATLMFGITLGNAYIINYTPIRFILPSQRLELMERNFFSEIAFILQTYFFVYVGVTIKFGSPMFYIVGGLIVAAIAFVRPFTVRVLVRKKMPVKDLAIMGIMSPKGLVPAILASIPIQMGIKNGDVIQDLAYAVVLISIVLCAILVIMINKGSFSIASLNKIFGREEEMPTDENTLSEEQSEQLPDPQEDETDDTPKE